MKQTVKIENNIIYVKKVDDDDPTWEMFPIRTITFIGKITKSKIQPETRGEFVYAFAVGVGGVGLHLMSNEFEDDEEDYAGILESIANLRDTRKMICEALELYHGGVMINKPKVFNRGNK